MDTLLTCPRCNAFVQPTWTACRICGYDPAIPFSGGLTTPPKVAPRRLRLTELVGALVTLALLVAGGYAISRYAADRYNHRDAGQPRQELVSIDR